MHDVFSLVQNKITGNERRWVAAQCWLLAFLIDVVYAEERAGKGGGLAEGYEEGLVDLSFRVNEDATEEHYEPS